MSRYPTLRPLAPADQAARRAHARPAPRPLAGARRPHAAVRPSRPRRRRRRDSRAAAAAARILMMGAHVLRAGVNRHIIDLIERGFIDHIAMNGAGAIHDYELARIGATTESVDRYIRTGEFGLWRETGELNDWIREAAAESLGLGENVGRRIDASDYPHKDLSVFAAAYRARRAGDGPRRHRLRHHPRASELRRRGAGRGQLSRFPDLRPHGRAAGRRRAAQFRVGDHGAGGVPEGARHGAQRGPAGGPRDPQLRHRRLRPRPDPRRPSHASCPRPIPATTSARRRRFWCAPSPMAARASISAAPHRATLPALWRLADGARRDERRRDSRGISASCACWWSATSASTAGAATIPRSPMPSARNRHSAHRRGRHRGHARAPRARSRTTWPRSGAGRVDVLGMVGDDGFGYELRARSGRARHLDRPAGRRARRPDLHLHQADQSRDRRGGPAARRFRLHRGRCPPTWNAN